MRMVSYLAIEPANGAGCGGPCALNEMGGITSPSTRKKTALEYLKTLKINF